MFSLPHSTLAGEPHSLYLFLESYHLSRRALSLIPLLKYEIVVLDLESGDLFDMLVELAF